MKSIAPAVTKDHPDWEEYDGTMRAQDAVIVLVRPQRVYGLVR